MLIRIGEYLDGQIDHHRVFGLAHRSHEPYQATFELFKMGTTFEQSTHESEERLRELADAIPQIVWIANPDGGLIYLNAKASEYTGVGMDQLTGWSWDQVIHPDDLPRTLELWTAALQDGIPRDIELRIRRVDGVYRWHITREVPVRNASGVISTWYGTCTDVEDLKLAEQALRESIHSRKQTEETIRKLNDFRETIIRTAAEGICVCYEVPTFPYIEFSVWNEQMTELTGYTQEEINRLGWYQSLYRDDATRTAAQQRMLRMRMGDDLRAEEWEIYRKDGERRIVAISTSRLDIEDGIPRVAALMHDVTNRMQAERELRRSEERFSKLFYASPFSIIVASYPDGKIIDANDAFLRIFEFDRSEVIGRTTGEINLWANPDDRLMMLERLQASESARDMEILFRTKSGRYRTLVMSVEIIRIDGGIYSLAMSIDITDRKQLEDQLRQSQKMEAIGQLAGGIAHDFNNLLTVINGYCELLLESTTISDGWQESVQEIRDAGCRAAQLTQQLLTFSRRSQFKSQVVDLNKVIAGSEKLLRRLIGEQITLCVQCDPSVEAIKVDTNQLEQVLMNLAVNARDAMPKGGTLTIKTSVVTLGPLDKNEKGESVAGPYAQLQISDSGVGMTKEIQTRIFEPFFTTKDIGKGSGLGLSVVHGIMQQNNGLIRVSSEPGEGTTFTLLFPHIHLRTLNPA